MAKGSRRKGREGVCKPLAKKALQRSRGKAPRICPICKKEFIPKHPSTKQIYCSVQHAQDAKNPHAAENRELEKRGSKRCSQCNRVKRLKLFHSVGGGKKRPYCMSCYRKSRRPRTGKDNQYQNKYGISIEEYDTLLASHGGKCWICGGGSTRAMGVDHNHKNDNVRGLLCARCNGILGRWKDNPRIAQRAVNYLINDGAEVQLIIGHNGNGTGKNGNIKGRID